ARQCLGTPGGAPWGRPATRFGTGADGAPPPRSDAVAATDRKRPRPAAEEWKEKEMTKRKILEYGGVAAGVVMIAIGVVSLVLAINGRSEVRSSLKQEAIVGSPDMTPDAIATEAKEAGLPASIKLPTCNVADQAIDTGSEAKC